MGPGERHLGTLQHDEDFSQANDLAQKFPEKLNELKALFWEEAEKYNVTPLLGGLASFFGVLPPNAGKTTKFTFYSGVENVGPGMIPHIYGTSYSIEADIVYRPVVRKAPSSPTRIFSAASRSTCRTENSTTPTASWEFLWWKTRPTQGW